MKTLRRTIVAAMMVMVATFGFAGQFDPVMNVETVSAKQIQLKVNGLASASVRLTTQRGAVLHSETYSNETGFHKQFDLSQLKAGIYFVEVEDSSRYSVVGLQVSKVGVILQPESYISIQKPIVKLEEGIARIFFNEEVESAHLSIFDNKSYVFIDESIASNDFNRSYDFSKVGKGNYFIKLEVLGKEFLHKVEIR